MPQPDESVEPSHVVPPAPPVSGTTQADEAGTTRFVRGAVPILVAATLWGTTGTAATFAPPDASAVAVGAATMGLGGLVLLALAGRSALPVLRAGPLPVVLWGAAAIAVYPLSFYTAMALAGVAVGTVVAIGSAPVFAALLERTCDGTRLERRWALATGMSAIGMVLLVCGGDGAGAAGSAFATAAGLCLGLVAGATYAGFSFAARRLMQRGHPSRAVTGLLFGLAAVVLLPVLALTGGPLLSQPSGLVVAGYLALVPMSGAYVFFGAGLRHVGTSTATTLSLVEPAVAALLSVAVVGERLSAWAWLGVALIGAGLVVLVARR